MSFEIHTPRLTLKALSLELFSDLRQANYFPAHLDAHLDCLKVKESSYGWGPWIIYLNDTKEVIGDIGFKGEPDSRKTVEVGYGIIKHYRNQGYASEALQAMLAHCFEKTDVLRVTAECRHDNLSSLKVLQKGCMLRDYERLQMVHWQLSKAQFQHQQRLLAVAGK